MAVFSIILGSKEVDTKTLNVIQCISEQYIVLSLDKDYENTSANKCKNMNDVLRKCNEFAAGANNDILIVSGSGFSTEVFNELTRVMNISERHVAVSPRGEDMGFLSIPLYPELSKQFNHGEQQTAYDMVADTLPDYHIIPYPSSVCVLLRGNVVKKFGLFDESCKSLEDAVITWSLTVGQVGYSSIAANKVFIPNGTAQKSELSFQERFGNIHKLISNYERFGVAVTDRFAGMIPNYPNQKPKILLCMYQLASVYNGTAEHSFSLARRFVKNYSDKYDFHLLISKENANFFNVSEEFCTVVHPEDVTELYHLGITFIQTYQNELMLLLNRYCLKIISTVLDLISYRCLKFVTQQQIDMFAFKKSLQFSDGIITISNTVKNDLVAAFREDNTIAEKTRPIIITNADCEELSTQHDNVSIRFEKFILVLGNHFEHKLIHNILPYIAGSANNFVIVGYSDNNTYPNIQAFASGKLSYAFIEQLYQNCDVLLYPSEYEGYGLPVVNALSKGKHVVISNTEINRELKALHPQYDGKFLFFDTFQEMADILEKYQFTTDTCPIPLKRTYDDVANETEAFIAEILQKPVDLQRLIQRNDISVMAEFYDVSPNIHFKLFIRKKYPRLFSFLKYINRLLKIKLK